VVAVPVVVALDLVVAAVDWMLLHHYRVPDTPNNKRLVGQLQVEVECLLSASLASHFLDRVIRLLGVVLRMDRE